MSFCVAGEYLYDSFVAIYNSTYNCDEYYYVNNFGTVTELPLDTPVPSPISLRLTSPPSFLRDTLYIDYEQERFQAVITNNHGIYPLDCIGELEQIPRVSIADFERGQYLKIRVGQMYSPTQLWIILDDHRHYCALCDIVMQMTQYYQFGEGRGRMLHHYAIKLGQICAALFGDTWYRVVIIKKVDIYSVKVFYIDYGTVACISKKLLKPLKRQWCRLAGQAVRARLAFLAPPGYLRRWPLKSTVTLSNYVAHKQLVAQVVHKVNAVNELQLWVWGFMNEDNIYDVNNQLVLEKEASYSTDVSEIYQWPSWYALETGATPHIDILMGLEESENKPKAFYRHVPPYGLRPFTRHQSLPEIKDFPYNSFEELQYPSDDELEGGPSTSAKRRCPRIRSKTLVHGITF